MQIGILQSGHFLRAEDGENEDYDDLFARLLDGHGFTFRTWNVVDMEFPPGPGAADGWLITGSRHGAYEDLPFIPPLEDFIRASFAAGVPMVGICFGHQIMAQAMGGKVVKHAGGWAAGYHRYDFAGAEIALNAWHQDQVVKVPEGADVLASSDFCANAALLYRGKGLSIQAHPEFGPAELADLIEFRRELVGSDLADQALADLERPIANDIIADRIADFFKVTHG